MARPPAKRPQVTQARISISQGLGICPPPAPGALPAAIVAVEELVPYESETGSESSLEGRDIVASACAMVRASGRGMKACMATGMIEEARMDGLGGRGLPYVESAAAAGHGKVFGPWSTATAASGNGIGCGHLGQGGGDGGGGGGEGGERGGSQHMWSSTGARGSNTLRSICGAWLKADAGSLLLHTGWRSGSHGAQYVDCVIVMRSLRTMLTAFPAAHICPPDEGLSRPPAPTQ